MTNYGDINENSTAIFRVTPTKNDGTEAIPTSAVYQVDDKLSGNSIVPDTSLTPENPLEIVITAAQNVMVDPALKKEKKIVTVVINFTDGTRRSIDFEYTLINLRFI